MSRDPKTAEATRAQVVSAALQSLARRLGRAAAGTQGAHLRQRRIQAGAAARHRLRRESQRASPSTRSTRIRSPADHESMLRSIAEQTGGAASINDGGPGAGGDAGACRSRSVLRPQLHAAAASGDGRFHPVQVRVKRPGALARSRSGYWAPDAALAAAARKSGRGAAKRSPFGRPARALTFAHGSACRADLTG